MAHIGFSKGFENVPGQKEHILTQEDRGNWEFFKTLYEKNASPLSGKERIPKILHLIWLGPKNFPESSLKNMRKWLEKHSDWTLQLWTDQPRSLPFSRMQQKFVKDFHFEFLEDCYYLSENYGEKSEILRYEILWQQGGVYVDHDTLPLRSFDSLNESYDFYCGLEPLGSSILSSSVFPSTHLLAAVPHHPIFKKSIEWLKSNWEMIETFYPGSDPMAVFNRVKHRTFSAFLEGVKTEAGQEHKDIVFPPAYFSMDDEKASLFARHTHAASWYQPSRDFELKVSHHVKEIEQKTRRTTILLILISALNLALLILLTAHWKKFRKASPHLLALFCLVLLASCEKKKQETVTDFEKFMGKNTEHWKHISQTEDRKAFDRFQQIYEKNKKYLELAAPIQKIPKVIHFIWLGPRPFPPLSVENVRTWMAQNPDWKVKFWTDRERPAPCAGMERHLVSEFPFSFLGRCFAESQNYGEQSDILRFEILYREGGVYADHDANCLIPFEKLHGGFDFYCGLEAPHPAFVGLNITSGNGLLGARPGHPVIKKVIDLIGDRWDTLALQFRGKDRFSKEEIVMQRTYIALTHALRETVDKEGNVDIVLPAAYFFAKTGIPSLYSKHFFATAWAEDADKKTAFEKDLDRGIGKIQTKSKIIQIVALLVLFLNLITLISFLMRKKKT